MVKDQLRRRGIRNERVLEAFRTAPREKFVAPEDQERAHDDEPLKIGYGQTISQPYIVALTCQALDPAPSDCVLEIGAGSGYETAILASLCRKVVSIERVPELCDSARRRLGELGITNAQVLLSDGTLGAPDFAPFDAIAVTAAAPDLPVPLAGQLRANGRMVIPIGNRVVQELFLYRKPPDGPMSREKLCDCRFVSLIGRHGFPDPAAS
ncbi:MAG: protein-L-isoaspartate O-methyltransferase [Candidatus Lindowbacteria bacterium RIFCSPLOWO2_12_FULL_62_27]|nr:MAG: protein-L-isoaspartate O-methyltransferase [Candidatus Lindowbacteria bacterium RIFCSPLOWO2_12_FULL_62_27]OGH63823.1 MAG: protein-L-isoaspartate O-methyltransferase [Candidatus Lindowbacteria bacterium RIFCSPLOWO2_02_FULL_62_12]